MKKIMDTVIDDLRIASLQSLITPDQLLQQLPLPDLLTQQIASYRQTIVDILDGRDERLLVVIGPCSIHDSQAALDYAKRLKMAAEQFKSSLFFVMRVYFDKPRTLLGWKGLISDPHLNGSYDMNHGLILARQLLLELTALGLPAATEFLDSMIPQYIGDLISWCAIGARTAESQIHRELASGLSMPVGFKNSTDGNIQIAVDAVNAARCQHRFLGISKSGQPSILHSTGNEHCHIILRGGNSGPNYAPEHVHHALKLLKEAGLPERLMIDCSHGNSMKNHLRQADGVASIRQQRAKNPRAICGVMLESHLNSGKQVLGSQAPLEYGVSITDACLSWDETLPLLEALA